MHVCMFVCMYVRIYRLVTAANASGIADGAGSVILATNDAVKAHVCMMYVCTRIDHHARSHLPTSSQVIDFNRRYCVITPYGALNVMTYSYLPFYL